MWKVTSRDCDKAWAIPALSWGGGSGSSGSGTLHVFCGLYLAFVSMREAVMVCLGEGSSSLVPAQLSQFPFPLRCPGCACAHSASPAVPTCVRCPSSHATLPAAIAPLQLGHLHSASCCWSPLERQPSKPPHQQMFDFQSCCGKKVKKNIKNTKKPVPFLYPWSREGGWVKGGLPDRLFRSPLQGDMSSCHQEMTFPGCCVV